MEKRQQPTVYCAHLGRGGRHFSRLGRDAPPTIVTAVKRSDLPKMFRFLSGRKARNNTQNGGSQLKGSKSTSNKNLIQCKVILLDGTDLSVELSVSFIQPLHRTRLSFFIR